MFLQPLQRHKETFDTFLPFRAVFHERLVLVSHDNIKQRFVGDNVVVQRVYPTHQQVLRALNLYSHVIPVFEYKSLTNMWVQFRA